MRVSLLALLVVMACRTSAPETAVEKVAAPRSPEEELAALLKSIPPECVAPTSGPDFGCPGAFVVPPEACVIERVDAKSERVTDWLVYVDGLLVRQELTVSSHAREVTQSEYDASRRLVRKTTCLTSGAGEPSWSPTWRPPFAEYETPAQERVLTVVTPGPEGNVADVTLRSAGGEGQQVRVCSWSKGAQRVKRIQTVRRAQTALVVDYRTYAFEDERLASMDVRSVSLQGTSVAGRNQVKVAFRYDVQGRLSSYEAGPSRGEYVWDEKGRLSRFNTARLAWNEKDQLVKLELGDPAFDGTFTWDEKGRIESAVFGNGEGYRVRYGASCPAELRAEGLTPSAAPFLSYEGRE
jgi:hypothetical protein